MSLGIWSFLIVYAISIPLGIAKAVRDGSRFDFWTSTLILVGYAIPGFVLGVALLVLFGGGSFWAVFPLRGLTSDNWAELTLIGKVLDYFWHLAMPLACLIVGSFAVTTMLTKNVFLEEIRRQYVLTARAKGLSRAARLLQARVPQCPDTAGHRLSGCFRRRLLRRLAADRGAVLARRAGSSFLRRGSSSATIRWCWDRCTCSR